MQVPVSAFAMSPDLRCVVDEVVAADERVMALRFRYVGSTLEGGGGLEFAAGMVSVIEDGKVGVSEWFEHDDRAGMLARYRELGGRVAILGARPPERLWAEFKRHFDAHDLEGMLSLYAADWRFVDHRKLGMQLTTGPDGAAELFGSAFSGSEDLRVDVEEVIACDERVIALQGVYRGTGLDAESEFEIPFAVVTVVDNGLLRRTEAFEPEDRGAIIARFAELAGPASRREPLRIRLDVIDRYNRHDVPGMAELFADDIAIVDRRPLGADPIHGRAAACDFYRTIFEMFPDIRQQFGEVIAQDDRVLAYRASLRGSSPDAADAEGELVLGGIDLIEDGRLVRVETFEPGEVGEITRRYAELGGGA
jgi:ketosteroid isomerase-like protein